MMHFIESELLRIFVGEQEKLHHRPIYELLVSEALERGMAGATVFRGLLSFGLRHKVHTSKIFELAGELPMVIEIVDSTEKIDEFLPVVETLLRESGAQALVTREAVRQWTT
jgi:PII-like signaling protein